MEMRELGSKSVYRAQSREGLHWFSQTRSRRSAFLIRSFRPHIPAGIRDLRYTAAPGIRYCWPVVSIAQSRLAIRFANATATTILGRVSSIRASQGSTQRFRLSIELITDIVPMISSRLTSFWPIFVTRPSRSLPPVECCRGTRPSYAAKSRPLRKFFTGGQKASTAIADIGPTPGMVCINCAS